MQGTCRICLKRPHHRRSEASRPAKINRPPPEPEKPRPAIRSIWLAGNSDEMIAATIHTDLDPCAAHRTREQETAIRKYSGGYRQPGSASDQVAIRQTMVI